MLKFTKTSLLMLVLGLMIIFLFFPKIISPKIQIETVEYDFGDISQQKAEKVLWVKNAGRQTLEIKRVSTSCGCTTASIDKTSIAAGESANLTITFDPNLMGEIGPVEKVVYIRSNDPTNEEATITVKMNVVPEKEPLPSPGAYECPKGEYVDCMPTVLRSGDTPMPKNQNPCRGEYHEWIKKNCPNIKGFPV